MDDPSASGLVPWPEKADAPGMRLYARAAGYCLPLLLAGFVVPSAVGAARPEERIPDQYIVVYEPSVEDVGAATRRREGAQGFRARRRYSRALKGFSARLDHRQVERLQADPAVAAVVADRVVRAAGDVPLRAGESTPPTGVRRIGAASPTTARQASAASVAVLDTGIDLDHPDLRVAGGTNCVTPGASPDDDHGHGTHVAGTIAAENDGAGVVGVAPDTPLAAVKVLAADGSGSTSSIVCGLDWALANGVDVMNMSLGGTGGPVGTCARTSDPMHLAVCRAVAGGVTVVAAAGNDGWDFDHAEQPDVPAAYPEVLTVTSVSDSDGRPGASGPSPCASGEPDDHAAGYSNFALTTAGAAHTLAAPGTCIRSTLPGGGHGRMSGTSMATPHVAGLVALCLEEGGRPGPCARLTPAEIIQRMRLEAASRAAADATYGFTGDPEHLLSGRLYGHLAWVSPDDLTPPAVTLRGPGHGSVLSSSTPTVSGGAGTQPGDAPTVTVEVFTGTAPVGSPSRVLTASRSGDAWSTVAGPGLPDGTYTARAVQADAAGNVGRSGAHTFTVQVPAPVATTAPASTPPPTSMGPASALTEALYPAKLEVVRSGVLRARGLLEVLAPITPRASGAVNVDFHAAGRHTRFAAAIDPRRGRVRFRRKLPREQARAGTGILTLTYPGNERTRGQKVRLRAAPRRANLGPGRPTLRNGRLRASGTISRRARGLVRVQLRWSTGRRDRSTELKARIRNGRWRLDEALPDGITREIARRDGSVHSYTLFTGYRRAGMGGEMRVHEVLGAP